MRDGEQKSVLVNPGEIRVSLAPTRFTTVLGSCVAACLWDSRRRVGGLNHFLLPHGGEHADVGRFADLAMPKLLAEVEALGCRRRDLRAKLFGGAALLRAADGIGVQLGLANVRAAETFLQDLGIPIVAADTGGTQGRRVVFETDTGDVWVRRL